MQCTSSIVIAEEMYFPFLYVTEPSCSGAGSPVTPIITREREMSHLREFEARRAASPQTLQNVGVGERSEGRRGEV